MTSWAPPTELTSSKHPMIVPIVATVCVCVCPYLHRGGLRTAKSFDCQCIRSRRRSCAPASGGGLWVRLFRASRPARPGARWPAWAVIRISLHGFPCADASSRLAVAACAVARRIALSIGPGATRWRPLFTFLLRVGVPSPSLLAPDAAACRSDCVGAVLLSTVVTAHSEVHTGGRRDGTTTLVRVVWRLVSVLAAFRFCASTAKAVEEPWGFGGFRDVLFWAP